MPSNRRLPRSPKRAKQALISGLAGRHDGADTARDSPPIGILAYRLPIHLARHLFGRSFARCPLLRRIAKPLFHPAAGDFLVLAYLAGFLRLLGLPVCSHGWLYRSLPRSTILSHCLSAGQQDNHRKGEQ